jgi:hypothetical protein
MKPKIRKWKRNVLLCAGSALLLAALAFASAHETRQLAAGEKATVTGAILSRDGDLIRILDKKSNEVVVVNTALCFFAIPTWTPPPWSQD